MFRDWGGKIVKATHFLAGSIYGMGQRTHPRNARAVLSMSGGRGGHGREGMEERAAVLPGAPEPAKEPDGYFRVDYPPHWEGDFPEVTLYDGDPSNSSESRLAEAIKVVHAMLPDDRKPLEDYQLIPKKIFEDFIALGNYDVRSIVRIQNRQRWAMGLAFNGVYKNKHPILRVYHGCTDDSAQNICKVGFRAAPSERSAYGQGVYSAGNIWEALAYAKPHALTEQQTAVVARLVTGPKAIGKTGRSDAGYNSDGEEILTTTNPRETYFCAKFEDQMVATYRVTFKYREDIPHTEAHQKCVRMWHPYIYDKYIRNGSRPAQPSGLMFLHDKDGFTVGDAVELTTPCYKQFAFAKQKRGKIVKIIVTQLGSPHQQNRFMIQLDDRAFDLQIIAAYAAGATRWAGQGDTLIAALSVGIKKVSQASGGASRLANFLASQLVAAASPAQLAAAGISAQPAAAGSSVQQAAAGGSAQQAVVVAWEPLWQKEYIRTRDKVRVLFEVDTRVQISSPHNKGLGIFNRFFGEKGTIKAIFQRGKGGNVHFCIELDDPVAREFIENNCHRQGFRFIQQSSNSNPKFPGQNTASWLVVTGGFIEKLDVAGAAAGVKRKAEAPP